MTGKPVVSEVRPAGHAFAEWIKSGGDPEAAPYVAFAAGHQSRDAEIEAADALEAAVTLWLDCQECGEGTEVIRLPMVCESRLETARDAYRAVRRTAGGSGE